MQDLIIPVNNEAHSRALIAVVGEEQAQLVLKAYQAIDAAMVFGYAKSQAEEADKRKTMAEEYVAALARADAKDYKEAFKSGYDAGQMDAYETDRARKDTDAQAAYDDGYIDGVSDARVSPSYADLRVAELCEDDNYDEPDDLQALLEDFEPETYETTDDFAASLTILDRNDTF